MLHLKLFKQCLKVLIHIFNRSISVEDTHREKVPSSKTPALTESTNMNIWVVVTLNQLFIGVSQTKTKFSKK